MPVGERGHGPRGEGNRHFESNNVATEGRWLQRDNYQKPERMEKELGGQKKKPVILGEPIKNKKKNVNQSETPKREVLRGGGVLMQGQTRPGKTKEMY